MASHEDRHWLALKQLDVTRALYEAEVARRESVRNSLAVPVAVLSFGAFGMGAVSNAFEWRAASEPGHVLALVIVVCAVIAAVLLITALFLVFRIGTAPEADVRMTLAEINANAVEMENVLRSQAVEPDDRDDAVAEAMTMRQAAISIAIEQLSEEYAEHTETLMAEVTGNLTRRRRVFAFAVPGFALLIASLLLTTVLQLYVPTKGAVGGDGQADVTCAHCPL